MFTFFRQRRQQQALLVAAVRAERWFTHQECVGGSLDYEAFQTADSLRGAVHAIQEDSPTHVELAEAEVKRIPYGD